jgi:hypothetical protein
VHPEAVIDLERAAVPFRAQQVQFSTDILILFVIFNLHIPELPYPPE